MSHDRFTLGGGVANYYRLVVVCGCDALDRQPRWLWRHDSLGGGCGGVTVYGLAGKLGVMAESKPALAWG